MKALLWIFPLAAAHASIPAKDYNPCQTRPKDVTQRVVVLSDMNASYGSVNYPPAVAKGVARVISLRPDLVLSTGDMVAGQWRNLKPAQLRAMWAGFNQTVTQPLLRAGIPFAVSPGNHDAAPGYADDQRVFRETWAKPDSLLAGNAVKPVDTSNYPTYYSFRVADALYLSLDSTTTGPFDRKQREWAETQLRTNRDARTKIVFGHVPPYPVAMKNGRIHNEARFDEEFERMLLREGVTQTFWGHQHAYFPARVRHSGLPMVGAPALGDGQRPVIGTQKPSPVAFLVADLHADHSITVEACNADGGFLRTVDRATLPKQIDTGHAGGRGKVILDRDDQATPGAPAAQPGH